MKRPEETQNLLLFILHLLSGGRGAGWTRRRRAAPAGGRALGAVSTRSGGAGLVHAGVAVLLGPQGTGNKRVYPRTLRFFPDASPRPWPGGSTPLLLLA